MGPPQWDDFLQGLGVDLEDGVGVGWVSGPCPTSMSTWAHR